jgi:hypothetical protein
MEEDFTPKVEKEGRKEDHPSIQYLQCEMRKAFQALKIVGNTRPGEGKLNMDVKMLNFIILM